MTVDTTEVDARLALVTKLMEVYQASEFSDVPMFGENGPTPNLDTLQTLLNYEIVFDDTDQATLGENPHTRTWGRIVMTFGTREGSGTLKLLVMRSEFKEALKGLRLPGVKTMIPRPGSGNKGNGWVFETLHIPFYFDSMPVVDTP